MSDWIGIIISIIALIVSIATYYISFARQRKIDTLNALSEIRVNYPNFGVLGNEKKYEYMQKMEFFATGVHEKIYDISIVKKMSRKRLISQYENSIKKYFNDNNINEYKEYRKLMEEIK